MHNRETNEFPLSDILSLLEQHWKFVFAVIAMNICKDIDEESDFLFRCYVAILRRLPLKQT